MSSCVLCYTFDIHGVTLKAGFQCYSSTPWGGRGGEGRRERRLFELAGNRILANICCCWLQLRGLVDSLANASMSAANGGLVRSVLACGFYPLLGRLLPVKGHQGGPRPKATIVTAKDEKVCRPRCCLSPFCYTGSTAAPLI